MPSRRLPRAALPRSVSFSAVAKPNQVAPIPTPGHTNLSTLPELHAPFQLPEGDVSAMWARFISRHGTSRRGGSDGSDAAAARAPEPSIRYLGWRLPLPARARRAWLAHATVPSPIFQALWNIVLLHMVVIAVVYGGPPKDTVTLWVRTIPCYTYLAIRLLEMARLWFQVRRLGYIAYRRTGNYSHFCYMCECHSAGRSSKAVATGAVSTDSPPPARSRIRR